MTTSALCANLEQFVDGELGPADADAFRAHLLTCAKCQAGLRELLQLGMLASGRSAPLPLKAPAVLEAWRMLWAAIKAAFRRTPAA